MKELCRALAWCIFFGIPNFSLGSRRPPNGFKQERVNDKFLLTSTLNGDGSPKDGENGCMVVDIHVPESYDPLPLCLKESVRNSKLGGFHKDFRLVHSPSDPLKKTVQSLHDLLVNRTVVDGYVVGMGISYVNGYFRENAFYGTLVYNHLIRDQNILCSILPMSLLSEFVDLSKMDEEEKDEFITKKTVYSHKKVSPNAIVTCGDMHRNDNDDVEHPFSFNGPHNPTNVRLNEALRRQRRQEPNPAPADDPAAVPPANNADAAVPAPLPGGADDNGKPKAPLPAPLPPGHDPSEYANAPPSKEEVKLNKTLAKLLKEDKHKTYYATVCYLVDANYLTRRFNGSAEEATLLLGGFVELTDWILRATDWNNDGIPDNIGIRLLEVSIDFISRELKDPDIPWGRADGGNFMKRKEAFELVKEIGKHMHADCDIRSGIGELNVAKYVLHETGGCTACKGSLLTSFINPYVEKFSPRGEQLRMMYHQIRLLTFSFVHTKSYCTNCTGSMKKGGESRESAVASTFENADEDWGACIVEGDVQSRSNIPLNSFRLSVCSKEDGLSCLKELAGEANCLQPEAEESYCGNGIIEGDEECDCGTLATCAEQQCTCSPRSGRDPCRKLSDEDSWVCFQLIRCRGFRFVYELGRANGSNFLPAFNTFTDGTNYRIGSRNRSEDGTSDANNNRPASSFLLKLVFYYAHVNLIIFYYVWDAVYG